MRKEIRLFKKWVIKIPSFKSWKNFLLGLLENIIETEKWKELSLKETKSAKKKREYFGSVIYSNKFGLLLIMEYYDLLPENFEFSNNEDNQKIIKKDIKDPSKYGITKDGKIKLINYGGIKCM